MTIKFIGSIMPIEVRWGPEETNIINSIKSQIDSKWPTEKNLFINLTWFGPQFNNGNWQQVQSIIDNNEKFDNLFFLATVDPVFINDPQRNELVEKIQHKNCFWIGNFQTEYEFNFFAMVGARLFKQYTIEETLLVNPTHLYLNYNRKPRQHRVELMKKIYSHGLETRGINTLGKDPTADNIYSKDKSELYLSIGEIDENYKEYTATQQISNNSHNPFGIPDDALSLHRMDIWNHHFLNIVGATEFFPWDPIFVTETQWKPILGLRPFIINGNVGTYQWLRNNGFRTFNHYFNGIDLENVQEFEVHDSIIAVLEYIATLDKTEIMAMYNNMLPDLKYNRDRFFEFAQEQKFKIENLFLS